MKNTSYRELTMEDINQELTTLPERISEKEYAWESGKVELDSKEAQLLNNMPPEVKNAEQRKAYVNGDFEYIGLAEKVISDKVAYHKLLNTKDCVMEIARNKRCEMKSMDTNIND